MGSIQLQRSEIVQRFDPCLSMQAEVAERLVEFEWPDKSELTAAKLKEIEASVPIPERVWALKNVGTTQAMSGPEGRARARQLLERAVGLKRELVGAGKHPGELQGLGLSTFK